MIRSLYPLVIALMMGVASMAQDSQVYELRTYTSEPGRQADTLKLMSYEGLPYLKKHKIDLVGVWTPVEVADERVFMLVRHKDKPTSEAAWSAFQNDAGWKEAVEKSQIDGKKPVAGIERVFLTTNAYSPVLNVEKVGNRIFELRTYITTPNNLPNLNARFQNHTLELFKKHGMTNIVYWSVRKGEATSCGDLLKALSPIGKSNASVDASLPAAGNALVYFLAHASPDAAKDSFGKFREDPNWQKALKESEATAGGPLTVKDGVKSLYLKPVAFSPLQ